MRFVLPLIVAVAASVMLTDPLGAARTAGVPRLAHTVVIVFENHERSDILGSGAAPTFEHLASTYAQATADYAVAHPSLPNYLALVSGSTHGVNSDCGRPGIARTHQGYRRRHPFR